MPGVSPDAVDQVLARAAGLDPAWLTTQLREAVVLPSRSAGRMRDAQCKALSPFVDDHGHLGLQAQLLCPDPEQSWALVHQFQLWATEAGSQVNAADENMPPEQLRGARRMAERMQVRLQDPDAAVLVAEFARARYASRVQQSRSVLRRARRDLLAAWIELRAAEHVAAGDTAGAQTLWSLAETWEGTPDELDQVVADLARVG